MAYTKQHPKSYITWRHMINRCNDPKSKSYVDYGKRGIKICDRWGDFKSFVEDMGDRPSGYTLDRIDNDGHYSLANCRWATKKEQALNRRSNRLIVYDGETHTICEWAEKIGISRTTLAQRLDAYGWSIAQAFRKEKRIRI